MPIRIAKRTIIFYADVYGPNGKPVKSGPKFIKIVVNEAFVERIRSHAKCVRENGLYKVQQFAGPVWLDKMPADFMTSDVVQKTAHKIRVETLNVNANEFWFEAHSETSFVDLISERISIADLD